MTGAEAIAFITPETIQTELSTLISEKIVEVIDFNLAGTNKLRIRIDENEYEEMDPTAKAVPALPIKSLRKEVRRVLIEPLRKSSEISEIASGQYSSLLIRNDDRHANRRAASHFYSQLYLAVEKMVNRYHLPISTDSEIFTRILHQPYSDRKFLKRGLDIDVPLTNHEALLSRKVLEVYLPDIADVPIEYILEARAKLLEN